MAVLIAVIAGMVGGAAFAGFYEGGASLLAAALYSILLANAVAGICAFVVGLSGSRLDDDRF